VRGTISIENMPASSIIPRRGFTNNYLRNINALTGNECIENTLLTKSVIIKAQLKEAIW
jgi:hypothetical protein